MMTMVLMEYNVNNVPWCVEPRLAPVFVVPRTRLHASQKQNS